MVDNLVPICYNKLKWYFEKEITMFHPENTINRYGNVMLELGNKENDERTVCIAKALSHPLRIRLLRQILKIPRSVTELAKLNKISNASIIFHLNLLEQAELIVSKVKPNKKGKTLVFYINFSALNLTLQSAENESDTCFIDQSMRVGNYVFAAPVNYIRIATDNRFIVLEKDDTYNPNRFDAQLICVDNGELSYAFSAAVAKRHKLLKLEFSLELSSESPYFCNDWKSEIIFSVCGIDVATYLSLGDYGGTRGTLTPPWWDNRYSQYGLLTTVTIDKDGTYLNGEKVSTTVCLSTLELEKKDLILFGLRTEQATQYAGGFNIYGKSFGNIEQDIIMRAYVDRDART